MGRNFDVPPCVPPDLATAMGLPVGPGLAATPETSRHTSIHQRVKHAVAQRRLEDLKAAACGSVAGSRVAGAVKEDLWLCPLEDRRGEGAQREGLL